MKIDIITLFPKMFDSPFAESIIKRAIEKNIINIKLHNLRQWALDKYGSVDDKPFGGDVGMLLRPEPIYNALKEITNPPAGRAGDELLITNKKRKIILMSAGGKRFDQKKAEQLSKLDSLIIIAGHYEGFDQRIIDNMTDEEISIGDYVLTGGELPAMVVIDAVSRLVPGVLGKDESSVVESFSEIEVDGKKVRVPEYPQYTRPREFMGYKVPEILLSGDPKKIKKWQEERIRENLKNRGKKHNNGKKSE